MMYPRLALCSGIFCARTAPFSSAWTTTKFSLSLLMDEIFGEQNFVPRSLGKNASRRKNTAYFSEDHDYILVYAR